ncbi:MAG: DUF4386 family protein [Chloroflexota bacterium]
MNNLQKIGGWAALYEAVAYIVGIVFFVAIVDYTGVDDPAQKVALLVDNQAAIQLVILIIYVIFGIALVALALALHEKLKEGAPALMQIATALGLIWAGVVIASGMVFNIGMGDVIQLYDTDPTQAATIWLAIDAVFNGIGGGVEILGGLWTLLVSWAALRIGTFSKALNYLGLVVGVAGSITLIPAFGEIGGMIFGLGQIVWFAWLGIAMLRQSAGRAETVNTLMPQQRAA